MHDDLVGLVRDAAAEPLQQPDFEAMAARGRRQRTATLAASGALALAVLVALAVAVASFRPTAAPIVGTIEEPPITSDGVVSEETSVGFAAARLAVLPATVPAGHVPDTLLVNDGAVSLFATPQCSLDQWGDDGWVDLEQSRFDRPYEIAPGEPGPWQSCLADTVLGQLDPGHYRIRWQVTAGGPRLDQPRLTVTGEFEVVDSDRVDTFTPLPADTRPAPPDEMPHQELADAMGLMEGEVPFLFPVPDSDIKLPVRAREGEWPLIAATSCDVLSSVQLPQGWSGLCLERTFAGQRLTDRRYPYSTTSVATIGAEPGETPPEGGVAEHAYAPLADPEVVDGQAIVPLRLPDGRRLEVGFPAELDFTTHGFDSSVPAVRLPGFERDALVLYGSRERVRERWDATVLDTYPDQRGGEVEFWRLEQDEVDHLVFEFGSWTVLYYDYREGGAGPRMTDQDRQLFAESLLGDVDEEGFLIVQATPPLEFYDEGAHTARVSINGDSGTINITNARCDPYRDQPVRGPGDLHWCDEDTGFSIRVFADSEVLDAVEDRVTVARAD